MNPFERAKVEHCKLTQGFPDNEYLAELDKLIYVFNKYDFKSIEELDNYLMSMKTENGEKQMKMSKELEALERIKNKTVKITNGSTIVNYRYGDYLSKEDLDIIETALKDYENLKLKHRSVQDAVLDDFKKLKALEIIRKKGINIQELKFSYSVNEYNICKGNENETLVQEEYNLLKEVLL